jgi:hypothetical protein
LRSDEWKRTENERGADNENRGEDDSKRDDETLFKEVREALPAGSNPSYFSAQ